MRMLLPLIPFFLAGCQTRQVTAHPVPLPAAEIPAGRDARIAPVIGHYTLGAYVDPENELIRHDAHAIQRIEVQPRWDLRTRLADKPAGPAPAAAAAPVAAADAPADKTPPVTPPSPAPVETPSKTFAATPAPLPSAAGGSPEPVPAITPNADGFIDLTAMAAAPDPEVNPFAVRSLRTEATREISVVLGGVVHGAVPCALVNGSPVQPGETVDSLTLVSLEPDAALFRHDDRVIRLPVAAKPARLRVAP